MRRAGPVPQPRRRRRVTGRSAVAGLAMLTCATASAETAPTAPDAAPGQVDVDEELVATALERALVQEGAIVLPPGTVRIDPAFGYARRETDEPVLLVRDDEVFAGQQDVRRDRLVGALSVQVGLPAEIQLGLRVPYVHERTTIVTRVGFTGLEERSGTDTALGDVSITASKGLLREGGWRPDVVASLRWDTDTGGTADAVRVGSGFNAVTGTITAARSQDPLVFVGSIAYTRTFEQDDIQPGRVIRFSFGTVLAASPETSLRFFVDQHFVDTAERAGQPVPGSDQVVAVLRIGASSTLTSRVLADVDVGIGLTRSAPDFSITVAFPLRFQLPRWR
jgi:hypothetical protein